MYEYYYKKEKGAKEVYQHHLHSQESRIVKNRKETIQIQRNSIGFPFCITCCILNTKQKKNLNNNHIEHTTAWEYTFSM